MGRGTGCYREHSIDTRINFQEQMRKPKIYCPKCGSDNIIVKAEKCQFMDCDKIF